MLRQVVVEGDRNREPLPAATGTDRVEDIRGRHDAVVPLEVAQLSFELRPADGWQDLDILVPGRGSADAVVDQHDAGVRRREACAPAKDEREHPTSDLHIASLTEIANLIDGQAAAPGKTFPKCRPADGAVLCAVPRSGAADVEAAVAAAHRAQPAWAGSTPVERGALSASSPSCFTAGAKRLLGWSSTKRASRTSWRSARWTRLSRWGTSWRAKGAVSTGARQRRRRRTAP